MWLLLLLYEHVCRHGETISLEPTIILPIVIVVSGGETPVSLTCWTNRSGQWRLFDLMVLLLFAV
jgi:hypothetical protein